MFPALTFAPVGPVRQVCWADREALLRPLLLRCLALAVVHLPLGRHRRSCRSSEPFVEDVSGVSSVVRLAGEEIVSISMKILTAATFLLQGFFLAVT